MSAADILSLALFATVCAALMAGFPVAFTLGGVGLVFALGASAFGMFDQSLVALAPRINGIMNNAVLLAVPLFVFMGVMLERSKVAEDLLDTMGRLFMSLRGGIGISVVIVGALLAASTGIVGATVVTMGLLSLPTMLRRGYDKKLATGTIAAAGTLGQIIPPSIVLILLGDQLSIAYQDAQLRQGIFSPEPLSVADLFAGALIPGLILVALYALYVAATALFRPETAPAVPPETESTDRWATIRKLIGALVPPLILIVAVLGSILTGIATATEAAAIGALGATFLAGYRICARTVGATLVTRILIPAGAAGLLGVFILANLVDLRLGRETISGGEGLAIALALILCALTATSVAYSLYKLWLGGILWPVMKGTVEITTMVFAILIGATLFSLTFKGLGGEETVNDLLHALPGETFGAVLAVMVIMFILGFFLEFIEITLVVVPIVAPILFLMGVDPVWLGVMMAINLQTSFLTPPFGFALFYLRGVAPPEIKTSDIYQGALPFVVIQVFALALVALVPTLATSLPESMAR